MHGSRSKNVGKKIGEERESNQGKQKGDLEKRRKWRETNLKHN